MDYTVYTRRYCIALFLEQDLDVNLIYKADREQGRFVGKGDMWWSPRIHTEMQGEAC